VTIYELRYFKNKIRKKNMSHNLNRRSERVTAPASEPVNLAEAKLYLRVDGTADDSLISDLIVAARMSAEAFLKSSLITQTWKLVYNDYVDCEVTLPMPPIATITSVVITTRDSTSQTVSPTNYYLNAAKNKLIFNSQVIGFTIEITYTAGYGNAAQIPQPIKYGILAHIAAMYDERGLSGGFGQANLPPQSSALYSPFREVML
jgi:uncharacterized phiE125 gp8 family phage protein